MAQFVSCSWSVVCLSVGCNTTTVDRNLHARSVLQQRSVRGATGQDTLRAEVGSFEKRCSRHSKRRS